MSAHRGTSIADKLNRFTYGVGFCFIVFLAVSLVCITLLSNHLTSFINEEYKVISTLGSISRGNEGTGRTISKMILSAGDKNQSGVAQYYKESETYRSAMEKGLNELDELESESIDHASVEEAIAEQPTISKLIEDLHTMCEDGKADEAWDLYESEYSPLVTSIRSSIFSIRDAANASAEQQIQNKDTAVRIAYVTTISIGVIATLVLFLNMRRTARSIIEPVKELEHAASRLRQGQLSNNITYEGDDELGSLCINLSTSCQILSEYVREIANFAEAINQGKLNYQSNEEFLGDFKPIGDALDQLSQTLSEDMAKIGAAAEQVYSGAEQMSSVGTRLSQSAVEQASSVQELVNTINTVSDHVTENATTATTARDSAGDLYNSIEQYSIVMRDMNQYLLETRDMTDKVRGIVRNLEMISFQTNTLALNAAVEAARAGDAGRGFAVIADEIRELASEASQASTNTGILLNDMVTKVSNSAEMSQRAIGSLGTILSDGNTTAAEIDKISQASNGQSAAIDQVRRSISELSQNIQSISSTAEESAASAEELQGQMKLLNQMVDSFEIRS